MKFSTVAQALTAIVVGAMSVVAQDGAAIAKGIDHITQVSIGASTDVAQLSISTAPEFFAVIVNDLGEINIAFDSAMGEIFVTGPLVGEDADRVLAAIKNTVTAQQALLTDLAAKAALIGQEFGTSIYDQLTFILGDVGAMKTSLLLIMPTDTSSSVSVQLDELSASYRQVIGISKNE